MVNVERYIEKMGCKCCGVVIYVPALYDKLKALQELVDFDILSSVTSGYRCPKHNEDVGGVPNSYHTQGKAVDVYIGGDSKDDERVISFKIAAKQVGFKRIGWKRYKGVFVHIDVGDAPSPAEW